MLSLVDQAIAIEVDMELKRKKLRVRMAAGTTMSAGLELD